VVADQFGRAGHHPASADLQPGQLVVRQRVGDERGRRELRTGDHHTVAEQLVQLGAESRVDHLHDDAQLRIHLPRGQRGMDVVHVVRVEQDQRPRGRRLLAVGVDPGAA
jgi:hypothetical protein